jgi:hypothetical protein
MESRKRGEKIARSKEKIGGEKWIGWVQREEWCGSLAVFLLSFKRYFIFVSPWTDRHVGQLG